MNKEELISKIDEIIKLDRDEFTDGEVVDMIYNLLKKEKKK